MIEFVSQIINGLAIGNIYALIALGFTLVFGVARLINFAQGSLFMVGAYLAFTGVTELGLPLAVAAVLAIAGATLLGVAIERIGIRPLERGPLISPFLSTLAIAILIDELTRIIWNPDPLPFPTLSGKPWRLGDTYLTPIDLMVFAASALAMVGLLLFLSRTWQGRAMRAAAQDPDAAMQMGVNVGRARQWAFGLAAGLGALAGVLVGMYYTSIFPTMGFPYAIKGFAAALLGGLGSVPGAIVGGFLLGVFESLASGYIGQDLRDVVAYALLLVVLLFRPEGILGKHTLKAMGGIAGAAGATPGTSLLATASGRPLAVSWRLRVKPRQGLLLFALACLVPLLTSSNYILQVLTTGIIFGVLAIGLTVVSGTAGQISIHHAALFGVGAYTAAILAKSAGLPAEVVLVLSALLTAAVAVIAAIPALNLSGHAVALASLALGVIGYITFLTWEAVTRGTFGITAIPPPQFIVAGNASVTSLAGKYWFSLVSLFAVTAATLAILRAPIGRAWRAIREDRPAAQAAGVPIIRYLAMAHGTAGAIAGVAGALFTYLSLFVSPQTFTMDASILLLTIVIFGGMGNVWGAIIGAIVLIGLYEVLRPLHDYRVAMVSLILLLTLRFRPQGVAGTD